LEVISRRGEDLADACNVVWFDEHIDITGCAGAERAVKVLAQHRTFQCHEGDSVFFKYYGEPREFSALSQALTDGAFVARTQLFGEVRRSGDFFQGGIEHRGNGVGVGDLEEGLPIDLSLMRDLRLGR